MDDLRELADVVNRNKVKSLRTLDTLDQDKVTGFYHKILDGDLITDDEASHFYFGSNASDPRYRRLKNKLKDRLWNSVIFIDVNSPKFNDAQRAHYTCFKNLIIIKTLLGRNARKTGIDLIKRTLKYAEKFEVSEVSLELYRLLRRHHASKTGNRNLYEKYNKKVKYYKMVVEAENLVLDFADHLSLLMVKHSLASKNYVQYSLEAIKELKKIEVTSYKFIWISKNIICNFLLHRRQYRELIEEANLAHGILEDKEHISDRFKGQFSLLKLIANIQISDYKTVENSLQECLSCFEEYSVGWYNTYDQYMIYLFRSRKYEDLEGVYLKIVNSEKFRHQTEKRKENWRTFEAYLHYLVLIGKCILSKENEELPNFRINKFLNDVPNFSMDKAGYNIPILVVQILILINTRKYDLLSDRIESIEKYTTRYLRKENNFRSNCFIKMLLQIPKRQYHKKAVERHATPYLKKLKSVPLHKANQSFEIEIIPYEHLWEYVLESLDNRFH